MTHSISSSTSTATGTSTSTRLARFTGLAYLGIILSGLFAEAFVRLSVIAPGDAAATTANIANAATLFRGGIVADLLMVSFDVAVAVGLYALLKHVHRPLAMLAAALRLIQAAVIATNLMNMTSALQLATGTARDALGAAATEALVLAAMDLHGVVYDLGLVFFGLACVVLGHLLRVSRLVPTVIAVGLSVAGVVYLVGSFAALFSPPLAAALDPMYGLALLGELGVAGWLVTKGLGTSTTTTRMPAAAAA